MKVSFGILVVTLPYSYQRGKVIYYQRPVPTDLRDRYTSKLIKVKLDTSNIRTAGRQIEILNRGVEAEWKAMRATPELIPRTIKQQAEDLLRDWDLAPVALTSGDDAAFLFHSHLDQKREAFARGDEDIYREADPSDYLKSHEIEAAKLIAGSSRPRLTDALDLYLSRHPKRNNEKFTKYAKQSFGRMVSAIGDKVLEDVSRDDGHEFVTLMLKEGLASASVRRLLNTARTVMATYIKERKVNRTNPFDSIPIPDEGEDAENAVPYTSKELGDNTSAVMEHLNAFQFDEALALLNAG